jgi:DNA-binding GntR family transcriptional regulator
MRRVTRRHTDRSYEALETAILSGRLKPRERLIETELATRLRTSRFLVRRAISELVRKGLAEAVPQKGARVVDISEKDVEDAYLVRMTLERIAAELMVKRIGHERLAAIKRIQNRYADAVKKGAFERMFLKNEEFHRALYAATENKLLCDLLERVRNATFPLRYAAYFIPARGEQSVRDHEAIIQALECRDLAALTTVLEASIFYPKHVYLSRKRETSP